MVREAQDREYVQSLERGLSVLLSFGPENSRMTLSEVAVCTGLTRATARRFLLTLERLGYVGSDARQFWLCPQVLELGFRYLSGLPWWKIAQSATEDASRELQESCNASVLDGSEIVYVTRVMVNRIIAANLSVGSRLPAYATAMGRMLLADLPDDRLAELMTGDKLKKLTKFTVTDPKKLRRILEKVQAQGYSIVDQELEKGLLAMAVPIVDRSGRTLAALGTSVPTNRVNVAELLERHLPVLRKTAQRVSFSLGAEVSLA